MSRRRPRPPKPRHPQGSNAPASLGPQGQMGRLRRNVGLVVINAAGQVLAGLRRHPSGDLAWQLPQGGIEGRERVLTAAYRELKEETGITEQDVTILGELPHWTSYWLPPEWVKGRTFVGQTQKWVAFRYTGTSMPDVKNAQDREFEDLGWQDPTWLTGHVIAFRQPIYREVFAGFAGFLRPTV